MDFKEIEDLAKTGEPLSVQYPSIYVIAAHSCLSNLYARFRNQEITVETATREKQQIKHAFEDAVAAHEKYLATYATFNDKIKISEDFRVKLHKAINENMDLKETFLLACTCIAVLTGDETLRGSKVAQQLSVDTIGMITKSYADTHPQKQEAGNV